MPAYITDSLYYLLSMNYQVLYNLIDFTYAHTGTCTHIICSSLSSKQTVIILMPGMFFSWIESGCLPHPATFYQCPYLWMWHVRLPSLLSSFGRTKTPASSSLHSSIPYAFQFNLCTGNISSSVCSRTILKHRHMHSNWTLLLITKKSPCHVFPPICDILVSAP